MSTPLILVHGTWGLDSPWWKAGSSLRLLLEAKGLPVVSPDFKWTGELGGVGITYPADPTEKFNARDLTPWVIAGRSLLAHARAYVGDGKTVDLITHSHGLQVGVFACAFGLRVRTFLSLSGPIRGDMEEARVDARPNIERWVQTYDPSPTSDPTIREGMLFDGSISTSLDLPEGDLSLPAPGFGHSGLTILQTPWTAMHLLDYFADGKIFMDVPTSFTA